ncbi:MAG: AAA family ATPase [Firmicutes bacterium]|nr:AAA family ATPase [Bacillota bacterium]
MARVVSIGRQDFEKLRMRNNFYVDKTHFIKEWWEADDEVTLITRPRRFGKTLNMSMLEKFFSIHYTGRSELFEGLSIWQEEQYRNLQGTYPVISLSFANVKEANYASARAKICQIIASEYSRCSFLLEGNCLTEQEKSTFRRKSVTMADVDATLAIHQLSEYFSRYYGKNVLILLDEYDTPMQEAYVHGYWEELIQFMKSLFNATFKTNPYLERALMTGITRVSRESIFSDLNNLKVVTTTSGDYGDAFGFTEEEVFAALEEFGLSKRKEEVKNWYDGFTFGDKTDIYNPWSIVNYLEEKKAGTYWANSSSNSLAGKLIQEGTKDIKQDFEHLLRGGSLKTELDEQIVYDELSGKQDAVWSLLLASGYLKVKGVRLHSETPEQWRQVYELELTNFEVALMFRNMIGRWFDSSGSAYNDFIKALLLGDEDAMNEYMNRVALTTFSSFDTGNRPSGAEPERFYHGFVLGLMVELAGRYTLTSNRESGFGRYDVMLEPRNREDDAIILEFKVFQPKRENSLEDTVAAALAQIEEKQYQTSFVQKGIEESRILKYGFAFRGKEVLIGS